MKDERLRIAVVGCGAVTELGHLPATARVSGLSVTLLVDKDLARAERLAKQYDVPQVSDDYTQVWSKADAAIIALPNFLHASVSIDLLRHGIHTLVEKPMALNTVECDAMILAAERGRAVLAVGLLRRFQRSTQFTKSVLDMGLLGEIETFEVEEGLIYGWPLVSGFSWHTEMAGGGVLIDTGVHTLDTLLWWLGEPTSVEYFDDSFGGVEAECEIHCVLKAGAKGIVKLSRLRNLRMTAIIRGSRATLEVSLNSNSVKLAPARNNVELSGRVPFDSSETNRTQTYVDLFAEQMEDWTRAIRKGGSPVVPGLEGRRSIATIEACYARRRPLSLPWMMPYMPTANSVTMEKAS